MLPTWRSVMRQFIWAFGCRICELEKLKQLAGAQGSLQSTSPDQRLPALAPGGGELLPLAGLCSQACASALHKGTHGGGVEA